GNATLNISGATNPTFENGYATFGLYLTPLKTWKYTAFEVPVTFQITTNVNKKFSAQFTATFHNVVWTVPDGIIALAVLLGVITILTAVACAVLTWYYSNQPIIRAATISFLAVILAGAVVMGIFIILTPLSPQHPNCILLTWLLHFGFLLMAAKQQARKVNWTTLRLTSYFLIIPGGLLFLYLVLWSLLGNWKSEFVVASDGVVHRECQYTPTFTIISLVAAIMFLLWVGQLAFSVRVVPKNFNESRWLGASVYTISIVFLFVIPLAFISSVSFIVQRIFVAVGCWIATQSVLAFLFIIKFVQIWTGKATKSSSSSSKSTNSVMVCFIHTFMLFSSTLITLLNTFCLFLLSSRKPIKALLRFQSQLK
ncbi:hypothetical protein RFI_13000, partial [Reticulomyxa filosa]